MTTTMVKVVQWAIKGTRRDAACGEVDVEVLPIRRTIITGCSFWKSESLKILASKWMSMRLRASIFQLMAVNLESTDINLVGC